jgi:hypothetical protein
MMPFVPGYAPVAIAAAFTLVAVGKMECACSNAIPSRRSRSNVGVSAASIESGRRPSITTTRTSGGRSAALVAVVAAPARAEGRARLTCHRRRFARRTTVRRALPSRVGSGIRG